MRILGLGPYFDHILAISTMDTMASWMIDMHMFFSFFEERYEEKGGGSFPEGHGGDLRIANEYMLKLLRYTCKYL
jgi:hypothetical protein